MHLICQSELEYISPFSSLFYCQLVQAVCCCPKRDRHQLLCALSKCWSFMHALLHYIITSINTENLKVCINILMYLIFYVGTYEMK